jgi:hypothetical protein
VDWRLSSEPLNSSLAMQAKFIYRMIRGRRSGAICWERGMAVIWIASRARHPLLGHSFPYLDR